MKLENLQRALRLKEKLDDIHKLRSKVQTSQFSIQINNGPGITPTDLTGFLNTENFVLLKQTLLYGINYEYNILLKEVENLD